MAYKGFIIGHSFVHGLHAHLSHGCSYLLSPVEVAQQLKLDHLISALYIHGMRGGMLTASDFSLPSHQLQISNPDFVLLDFGTNDLASGAHPLTVAAAIMDRAQELIQKYNVKQVYICSALRRSGNLKISPSIHFEEIVQQYNCYLKTSVK